MTDVDRPDWARISGLLDNALAVPTGERERWLASLPARDADLAATLRDLLARASAETDEFMRKPVRLRGAPEEAFAPSVAAQPGMGVGAYRLLREIGAGGMGAVWLAERADGMLRRQVALKLPRLAWDTPGLAARMVRERDILAGLEHPNIARLYDAGVDAQGRPYLAMEYIDGRPLDVYCNEHGLDAKPRLELFLQVARAVAHAHARLVVHRDLKPSNLLVTADGSVHLLDFGIAKIIEGDPGRESARETQLTELAGRALTPDYAAPEQIRGEAITIAVDVYSLGVVLYELLTDVRPSAVRVADAEGAPLASSVAKDRKHASALRGDLDTILAKALKAVPTERYASVDAFAADVQRHLEGAPVLARPDSILYRASRLVRRHKLPAVLAALTVLSIAGGTAPVAAVMIALAAGVGVALWQAGIARTQAARAAEEARQAQRERDRAFSLLERHEAAVDFLQVMVSEGATADEKVTRAELLERSERLALTAASSQPELQATVLDMLASMYNSFGDYAKAESILRSAIELVRDSRDVTLRARIECNHALTVSELGSVELARRTIESWLACPDVEPHVAALCQQYLAEIARNNNDAKGALANALGAQARLRESPHKSPVIEASIAGDIAYALHLNGCFAEADRQYAAAMQLHRDLGREESPTAIAILNNWGLACIGAGDVRRALEHHEEAMRISARRAPDGAPPPYLVGNHAYLLNALARYEEAFAEAERACALAERAGATLFRLNALVQKAVSLRERGDVDGASRLLAELAPSIAEIPQDSFVIVGYRMGVATVALRRERYAEAAEAVDPIVRMLEARRMPIGILANALRVRAEARLGEGKVDDAAADIKRAVDIAEALRGDNPSSIVGICEVVHARVEHAAGRSTQARETLARATAQLVGAFGEDHPETRRARELAAMLAAST
jgi:serine/threonine-protein kinase